MTLFIDLFLDHTLRTVALGSLLLGIISGVLGSFALLRRQSLLGDMVSHAALPGIGLSFLIIGSKNTEWLLFGAFIAAWLATMLVSLLRSTTKIKFDSAIGMTLAVFFGFGLVLLTYIQKLPNANQAGLEKFLFGQASTLMPRDVLSLSVVGIIAILVVVLFWKEFKIFSFDPNFAEITGFSAKRLDLVLTTLTVIGIVAGLQSVGVVLMSAMLIAPAVAARQWTDDLKKMVLISALFGAFSGIIGTLISSTVQRMPTGPIIAVVASVFSFISLFFAPKRGLFWKKIRDFQNKRELNTNMVLHYLYSLARNHPEPFHPHNMETISLCQCGFRHSRRILTQKLKKLEVAGLVEQFPAENWAITPKGFRKMQQLYLVDKGENL